MYLGWIEDHYTDPVFHFSYWGFEWVKPLSVTGMYAVHILMIASATGVMFLRGITYRIAAILLFLSFTYTELIDLTYYLNHYYFVSLVCLLLCVIPADSSILAAPKNAKVPQWAILIFKFQISFLYVYAGLAKLNHDWLIKALPLKIWLPAHDTMPLIGELFTWKITPYAFSWLGMLYDCFIVFFLLNKKTRIWAYITVVVFHALTGFLFQIGVFPLVMMGVTLIFFSDNWHQRFLTFLRRFLPFNELERPILNSTNHVVLNTFLAIYCTFQLLFPWRCLFYDGNLFWTEEGYRYSWRVMLMEKAGTATFYVKDTNTGREGIVVNNEFLNAHQEKQMAFQPDMILQFAHFLGNYYEERGVLQT